MRSGIWVDCPVVTGSSDGEKWRGRRSPTSLGHVMQVMQVRWNRDMPGPESTGSLRIPQFSPATVHFPAEAPLSGGAVQCCVTLDQCRSSPTMSGHPKTSVASPNLVQPRSIPFSQRRQLLTRPPSPETRMHPPFAPGTCSNYLDKHAPLAGLGLSTLPTRAAGQESRCCCDITTP